MTDLVLNAAPFIATVIRQKLEALGLRLSQAVDAFVEYRMRIAMPARLLRETREANRPTFTAPVAVERSGASTVHGDADPTDFLINAR